MSTRRDIELASLTEAQYPEWDKFVANQRFNGSIYSTAAYLEILSSVSGGSFSIVVVRERDQIVGGIGLYAFCHPDHAASVRVLEKCRFVRDDSAVTTMTFPNLDPVVDIDVLCFRRWC